MYQGVFNQCTGVAHNSSFSDFSESAELFIFMLQYLHIWGIYLPIYFLFNGALVLPIYAAKYGAITHPIYFNEAFTLPVVCCLFHCTLNLPFLWGTKFHMGHLSIQFMMGYISFPFIIFFSRLMGHLSFP